jgi:hypothetical protein
MDVRPALAALRGGGAAMAGMVSPRYAELRAE